MPDLVASACPLARLLASTGVAPGCGAFFPRLGPRSSGSVEQCIESSKQPASHCLLLNACRSEVRFKFEQDQFVKEPPADWVDRW